jgi:hypothetical protein
MPARQTTPAGDLAFAFKTPTLHVKLSLPRPGAITDASIKDAASDGSAALHARMVRSCNDPTSVCILPLTRCWDRCRFNTSSSWGKLVPSTLGDGTQCADTGHVDH